MTGTDVTALTVVLAIFALAIWRSTNIGLIAMTAIFGFLAAGRITEDEVFESFPVELVILVVGVMLLWGHARRSGLVDRILDVLVRVAGRRTWALPWMMSVLTAMISALGALPAAALAITLPPAMRLARIKGISPLAMAIVTIQGAGIGGFSPISSWGTLIKSAVASAGVAFDPHLFFVLSIVLNVVIALVAHASSRRILVAPVPADEPEQEDVHRGWSSYEVASAAGLAIFVALMFFSDYDTGLVAFALGVVLQLVFLPDEKKVVAELPWHVVLLLGGMVTYLGVLESLGTLDALGDALSSGPSVVLTVLLAAYLGTLLASVESSSVAVFTFVVPVVASTLSGNATENTILLVVATSAVAAIGASPVHLAGSLALAESATALEGAQPARLFRGLLAWSIGVAIAVPLLTVPFAAAL